jgi:tRNA G18 (ribose-2'-O)-methylase SpoU
VRSSGAAPIRRSGGSRSAKRRARGDGLLLLEGVTLVEEALGAGLRVVEAAFSERAAAKPTGRALLERLQRAKTRGLFFADALLDSLAEVETSQGVIALAEPKHFVEADVFASTPLLIACWAIQNPGNLGGLLRTAEAAGATGALLGAGCADPFGWKALARVDGQRVPAAAPLRARGARARRAREDPRPPPCWPPIARARRPLRRGRLASSSALLLGSEGGGLPPELLESVGRAHRDPAAAPVESLNVGVAAGIVLFEAARQRRTDAA